MNSNSRSLVVIQLSGGNDYLNTIVPYTNGIYYDSRPSVSIQPNEVLDIDGEVGFRPGMERMKELWDQGKLAVINGIGYPNPNRSHFRSMDIWHTALPEKIGKEGWLGLAIKEMDPHSENILTGVNFGRGLPRALGCKDVPITSVNDLDSYGFFPNVGDENRRRAILRSFSQMYGGADAEDRVMGFLGQTGLDALRGADILNKAPTIYSSNVEYADNPIAQNLKSIAQVMFANFGTRVYYTQYGSFDTHAGELPSHAKLWSEVSSAIGDFTDDLMEHKQQKETLILVFSEFGRRIKDNGSGTDHGSGGVAFVIGESVKSGMYGEYPSLKKADQLDGDLHFNNDFRQTYSTILEQWLGLDAIPIVHGRFDHLEFITN